MIRLPRWREYYNPLHGLTMARLAFLDTLAWEVRTTEGADPALAQEQAELLWKQRGRGGGGPPPSQLWR